MGYATVYEINNVVLESFDAKKVVEKDQDIFRKYYILLVYCTAKIHQNTYNSIKLRLFLLRTKRGKMRS
jgi:ribosome biogenesis protein Tsr3